jgi:ribonuclease J
MAQKFNDEKLYFLPLGGSNEIGMNLNLYRYKGQWLMVDLGIGFSDDYVPGADVIVPDISFLLEQDAPIAGLVLTHAHEDHLGAVPYLWDQLQCPVYATPFTANVLRAKLRDSKSKLKMPIEEVQLSSKLDVGPFQLDLINLTHSIPEMHALAIRTDQGTVLHTGDWKLDPAPMVGEASDEKALAVLGEEGVLAMVCDSTNVFNEGESGSEETVRKHLTEAISQCEHRVVVTTFASNIARLETVMRAAADANRKVVMAGRSLWRMLGAAQESGYLQDVEPPLKDDQGMKLPRHEVLILTTGCQGEVRAGLWRMAANDHPNIKFSPGDTVFFSSREIPGNEKRIGIVQNRLVQMGVKVVTANETPIHVSGHPARGELTRMYQLVKPQVAIPVHGEQRHMAAHAELAKNLQVPHAVVGWNGAAIELSPDDPHIAAEVESGYVAVDGKSLIPVDGPVMRVRRKVRDECVIFLSMLMADNNELQEAKISAPGLLDPKEDADWLADMEDIVMEEVQEKGHKVAAKVQEDAARAAIRRFCRKELGKRPVIVVHRLCQ